MGQASGDAAAQVSAIVSHVREFYETTDETRRQQLNQILTEFREAWSCEQTLNTCFVLLLPSQPPAVQFYGALIIYDTIRLRWEECLANTSVTERLKTFLVASLSNGAGTQAHSITNKLSASLALLALYSLPDVWPQPVSDLTHLWCHNPELLLRVLAELAAEFANVQMPLTQRSVLKTELHRLSEDMIRIINTVLNGDAVSSPSVRNAAVECVEQWLQLPGVGLEQWTSLLAHVFQAVSDDVTALTNLLTILAANEELTQLEQLVVDICRYIAENVAQKVKAQLRESPEDADDTLPLVSAICTLSEKALSTLIKNARGSPSDSLLIKLATSLLEVSNWGGRFPVDEAVSELPAVFWTTLREELCSSSSNEAVHIKMACKQLFASQLSVAIEKLSFPPEDVFKTWSKEEQEKFTSYRANRCEVAVDALNVVGNDTLIFLNQALAASFDDNTKNGDACRCEAVMFLWESVADYVGGEAAARAVTEAIHLSALMVPCLGTRQDADTSRLFQTLMRLLFSFSHLVSDYDNVSELEETTLRLILAFLSRPDVAGEALKTLEKYTEERTPTLLALSDEVCGACHAFFVSQHNPSALRLTALRSLAFTLSLNPADEVLATMDSVVESCNAVLSSAAAPGFANRTGMDEEIIFHISVFCCLFSSLQPKRRQGRTPQPSVVPALANRVFPVLSEVVKEHRQNTTIVDKVCEALRNVLGALNEEELKEILSFYLDMLNYVFPSNAAAACALTRTLLLMVHTSGQSVTGDVCAALRVWFSSVGEVEAKGVDEMVTLAYHIMKREWKMLRAHPEHFLPLLSSIVALAARCLQGSADPSVVKLGAQTLATIASQASVNADDTARDHLAQAGGELLLLVFRRVKEELLRQSVEALAEVLFFYAKEFPAETRECLRSEEHGESPLVAAMFREVGNLNNFKRMTIRLNLAVRHAHVPPS